MRMGEALRRLGDLGAEQWGLVTTAQAALAEVDRLALSRLSASGLLDRIAQGVYRLHGAPEHPHEAILAAWLALATPDQADDELVVAGAAAARLHSIGQLPLTTIDLGSGRRRSTRRDDVRFRQITIDKADIVTACGVPTMSAARTIVDVLELGEDPSNVAELALDAIVLGLSDRDAILSALDRSRRAGGAAAFSLFTVELDRRLQQQPVAA